MTGPFCLVAISPPKRARRWKKTEDFILDTSANTLPLLPGGRLSQAAVIDTQESFRDLMRRVREGSEDAAWELVEKYGGYIRRAVRRVLNHKLRSKFDSLDFVQLVWNSFFHVREEADRFEGPEHLVKFLAGMARNKVQMEVRHRLSTEQFDVAREITLGHSPDEDGSEIAARGPGPVDVAIAQERWERLLQDQPAHYRQIIQLKLQGHSTGEIATRLGLDGHTVRRFLKRLLDTAVL